SARGKPPLPISGVGDEYVELAIATALVARVIRDVNRGGWDQVVPGVDELELQRVARAIISSELGLITLGVLRAGHGLGEEPEHGLNKFITHARTKAPASSTEVGLDALEVRPADDDAVELQCVTHEGKIMHRFPAGGSRR